MTSETVGAGSYKYRLVKNWAKLPEGETFGLVSDGACDSTGLIYVCQRKNPPIRVFDADGNAVSAWGEGLFGRPHGVSISDDVLYIADDLAHVCMLYSPKGDHILTLGTPGEHSDTGYTTNKVPVPRSAGPFNKPTKLVKGGDGDLYASDGYGNARVHRFSAAGELKKSWGTPGSHLGTKDGPGEFHLVHSILVHDERVYVADRENERLQIYSTDGDHRDTWLVPRPLDIAVDNTGTLYVSGRIQGRSDSWIWVMDVDGKVLAELPSRGAHGIWVDAQGSIYAGLSRHHSAAVPQDAAKDPDYVPPTDFGGQGIVGAVDKFERLH